MMMRGKCPHGKRIYLCCQNRVRRQLTMDDEAPTTIEIPVSVTHNRSKRRRVHSQFYGVEENQSVELLAATKSEEVLAATKSTEVLAATKSEEVLAATMSTEVLAATKSAELLAATKSTEVLAATKSAEVLAAMKSVEVLAAMKSVEELAATKSVEVLAAMKSVEELAATKSVEELAATKSVEELAATKSAEVLAAIRKEKELASAADCIEDPAVCFASSEDYKWMKIENQDGQPTGLMHAFSVLSPPNHSLSFLRIRGFDGRVKLCSQFLSHVFVLIEGELTVRINNKVFKAQKGDSFYILPKMRCIMENKNARTAELSMLKY